MKHKGKQLCLTHTNGLFKAQNQVERIIYKSNKSKYNKRNWN